MCLRRFTLLALSALIATACGDARQEPASNPPDSLAVAAPRTDTSSVRAEPTAEDALRAAVERLVRGDGAEVSGNTWFSATTAGALRTVSVDTAGHAVVGFVDLQALIPNASSSAGSAMLLEELHAAVFSVDGIRSVEYRMDGSCERFWGWLQYECQTVRRP